MRASVHGNDLTDRTSATKPVSRAPIALLHWLLILLSAVLVTRAMWAPALLAGHSARFDFVRMVEFDAAIRAGDYFPRWTADFYFGYGSPLFQFYSPLAYYLTELPILAGLGVVSALKTTQLLALIASGLTMYHLARGHVSRGAACFAAVLYMVAPYRFVDLFVRHALAEHCAFLWLPLIVWGTEGFAARRSRAAFCAGALATAGLVLTHNVMALISLPICVAAGCFLSGSERKWGALVRAVLPAALGLGLSAFFWWPALNARDFIKAESSLTSGHFDYHTQFVDGATLLDPSWGFTGISANSLPVMPLQFGLLHLLAGAAALLLLLLGKSRTRWTGAGVIITGAALFMCHPASAFVWSSLPLIRYVQFPWRFLGLAVFGSACCGAGVIECIRKLSPRLESPALLVGIGLVLFAYFPCFAAVRFWAVDARTRTPVAATLAQVETLRAAGQLIGLDEVITPQKIRAANESATAGDDFLPRAVMQKPAAPSPELMHVTSGEIRELQQLSPNHYRAQVSMNEPGRVELEQFWFPGWIATVDGQSTASAPFGKMATVSCEIPRGEHELEFEYHGLPQRRIGMPLSFASIAFGALIFLPMKTASQIAFAFRFRARILPASRRGVEQSGSSSGS